MTCLRRRVLLAHSDFVSLSPSPRYSFWVWDRVFNTHSTAVMTAPTALGENKAPSVPSVAVSMKAPPSPRRSPRLAIRKKIE
jgi:hypothetical protein